MFAWANTCRWLCQSTLAARLREAKEGGHIRYSFRTCRQRYRGLVSRPSRTGGRLGICGNVSDQPAYSEQLRHRGSDIQGRKAERLGNIGFQAGEQVVGEKGFPLDL